MGNILFYNFEDNSFGNSCSNPPIPEMFEYESTYSGQIDVIPEDFFEYTLNSRPSPNSTNSSRYQEEFVIHPLGTINGYNIAIRPENDGYFCEVLEDEV